MFLERMKKRRLRNPNSVEGIRNLKNLISSDSKANRVARQRKDFQKRAKADTMEKYCDGKIQKTRVM